MLVEFKSPGGDNMIDNQLIPYIDEMSEALDDEIKALKDGDGGKRINLIEGEYRYKIADKYIYIFIIDTELFNIEDLPGQLIILRNNQEKRVQVTVTHIEANEISLSINEDLGDYISEAILNIAPYYLLEILKERLREIKRKKITININLLVSLFKDQVSNTIYKKEIPNNDQLNEQQYKALKSSLQNDITFIWGPPGTGKTHTISNIITNFIEQDKRVLIVSHTNSAIDTALNKVAELIKDKRYIDEGKIVRVGIPYKKVPDQILIEKIIKDRSQELFHQKELLRGKIENKNSEIKKLNKRIELFEILEDKELIYKSVGKDIKREKEILNDKNNTLKNYEGSLKAEENELLKVQNSNVIVRLFYRTEEQIKKEIKNINNNIYSIKESIISVKNKIDNYRAKNTILNKEINNIRDTIKVTNKGKSKKDLIEKIRQLKTESDNLHKKSSLIDKEIEEICSNVIKEALVIGTTLAKTSLDTDIFLNCFDVVIIDEASMAPIPNLFFASGLSKQHLIISGDFRQLAPIAVAKTKMSEKWLKKDIYYHTGIESNIDQNTKDERLVMLTEQFRLSNTITEIINPFYFGRLNSQKVKNDLKIVEPFNNDILFCDTSTINPWCSRPRNSYSRYNIYTAFLSVNIAEDAIAKEIKDIGIITPYSAQAQLIRKIVQDKGLTKEIKVATVHKYQGDEKDLIIIDTVDGLPYKIGKLMIGGMGTDAMRLINVAISRTKNKLVVVNNYDFFKKKLYNDDSVYQVINQAYDSAKIIFPESYISTYANVDPLLYIRKKGFSFDGNMITRNEADFYHTFKEDLKEAKEKIIIISPFITKYRLSDLMDCFRYLIDKGIEIIILTRPVYQQAIDKKEAEEIIRMLNEFDIQVIIEKGIHQKIAFIDKAICWFGSLNILSQNKSQEEMISFRSPGTIDKLYSFFRIEFYINKEKRKKNKENNQNIILEQLKDQIETPKCPYCSKIMKLRFGKYGPFFGCADYPKCKKVVNIPSKIITSIVERLSLVCSDSTCNGNMKYRRSQKGVFLGCSNYPDCKNTINLK